VAFLLTLGLPGRPRHTSPSESVLIRKEEIMTTQKLPGTEAARHGTGDADLTIMLAAHDAFRRDLVRLARAASFADLPDPGRRQTVKAGWDMFKMQLHMHHTAEDEIIWPVMRERLAHSASALSVLDSMEEEHKLIDPLLAAVDHAFDHPEDGRTRDVTDALTSSLSTHLAHEERDALPLIGVAFTAGEWRGVGLKTVRKYGLAAGGRMFAWMTDGTDPEKAAATIRTLPPPVRLIHRAIWKPRYARTPRW
jgi:iron-sulfur cluster repair protein YtfE (RIC family)